MRSWKTSASESIFSVQLPGFASTSNDRGSKDTPQRNRKPCGRCSDKQKKCDISPPYSSTRCGACTKANIPFCPPHKTRRSNTTKNTKTPRSLGSEQEQAPKARSRPSTPQTQYSGNDAATVFTHQQVDPNKGETPARDLQNTGLGLDRTDVLMTLQDAPLLGNSAYYDLDQTIFNGGLDSETSLHPINGFLGQSEDVFNGAGFVFPNVFVPAFLPSL